MRVWPGVGAAVLLFLVFACFQTVTPSPAGPPEDARIVSVRCGDWNGCWTVVEFADRTRLNGPGDIGVVGDTVRVRPVSWWDPIEGTKYGWRPAAPGSGR